MQIQYCPTEEMLADYMTKPLVGTKFKQFHKFITNCINSKSSTLPRSDSRSVLEHMITHAQDYKP